MDSSKSACADVRHRALFHSAFGIFVIEKIFGTVLINSKGKAVSVRDIAEQHVQEDLGFIPSLETWVRGMSIEPWMMGKGTGKSKFIPMEEPTPPLCKNGHTLDYPNQLCNICLAPVETFYNEANTDGRAPAVTVDPAQITFDGQFNKPYID